MKLSANFILEEMTKSQTALRKGIPNNPNATQIDALRELCLNVLQPIRSFYDKAVTVSSGYRSCELCIAIGSSIDSQHAKGEAADIEIIGLDNKELFDYIKNNIDFDQMILEFYDGSPNSGWIHVSYVSPKENRKQTLKAYRDEETQKVRYQPYS